MSFLYAPEPDIRVLIETFDLSSVTARQGCAGISTPRQQIGNKYRTPRVLNVLNLYLSQSQMHRRVMVMPEQPAIFLTLKPIASPSKISES